MTHGRGRRGRCDVFASYPAGLWSQDRSPVLCTGGNHTHTHLYLVASCAAAPVARAGLSKRTTGWTIQGIRQASSVRTWPLPGRFLLQFPSTCWRHGLGSVVVGVVGRTIAHSTHEVCDEGEMMGSACKPSRAALSPFGAIYYHSLSRCHTGLHRFVPSLKTLPYTATAKKC